MFMQKLLLILVAHQQFLCHASWATRTIAAAAEAATTLLPIPPTAPTTIATVPLVSASEATLLTTRIFPGLSAMQMQRQLQVDDNEVLLTASASASTASTAEAAVPLTADTRLPTAQAAKSRYKIMAVKVNCSRDLFDMRIELNRDFRGLLYAKDFPLECRARGTSHANVTLRLPTSGCGVRSEPHADGTLELSVRIMLQMEEKLRQSSDILRTVRCMLPLNAVGMTLMASAGGASKMRKSLRNGRMRSLGGSNDSTQTVTSQEEQPQTNEANKDEEAIQTAPAAATPTATSSATPRVRIWLELGGPDGSGAVEVGQATTLTVRAIVPGTMGVRVVDCAALDGLGDSTQQLLDERGCPIDEQVMPALHTRFKPAEEGWSKHHEDDPVEKTFTATFPAFKFPDRERLHVSCGVQLCKGKCPNINCRTTEPLLLTTDKHLARIEVFNSLAVTAPQIEVDRLRYDRRYNMSAEEYPPHIRPLGPSDGTLCLSVSKLALSFCVLGLIFLIAVVVAICSLIRSRRRAAHGCSLTSTNSRGISRPDICTSMFSSSSESAQSARFGSKLFIPYYPNTLPYGRVY